MALRQLLATIAKELLLLWRDRSGLALLFVMPALLVVVVTLVQDKVTATSVDLLLVDEDHGLVGAEIRKLLAAIDTVRLVEEVEGRALSAAAAQALVADSRYQFALLLPAGLSQATEKAAERAARANLFPERPPPPAPAVPEILVWFDPTVHGSFRAAVRAALGQARAAIETRLLVEKGLTLLPEKLAADLPPSMRQAFPQPAVTARELLQGASGDSRLLTMREQFRTAMGFVTPPTAVQQNVPAWAIFGIFFIVVPLAGSLQKERDNTTLLRLRVMPVRLATVLGGKVLAFLLVCLLQFATILLAGILFLPLLGLPAFDPGNQPLAFLAMATAVSAAACGYGILLGTVARTYEQIAVFGPVSIVVAAALGGVMVPIYALPEMLRPVCLFSPLYWGQSGFYDLLLRQGGLAAIIPEAVSLVLFGGGCLAAAVVWGRQTKRNS